MNRFFYMVDKFKYGIIAAFASYIAIFMYLQMETYTEYYPIEPFFEEPRLIIPEEIKLKTENIQVPPASGEVKNIARDMNDTRKRSMDNWSQNKASSKDVEQDVKNYEKQLFESAGGAKERDRIKQEMDNRKSNQKSSTNSPKETTTTSGGNTAYAGSVMVDWSLSGRSPHQNNNWYVRNPGYTCGHGSAGRITVRITVNQNGDVISAVPTSTGTANGCMIEQALKYAKMSRFNFSGSSVKSQEGTITYTFIAQ